MANIISLLEIVHAAIYLYSLQLQPIYGSQASNSSGSNASPEVNGVVNFLSCPGSNFTLNQQIIIIPNSIFRKYGFKPQIEKHNQISLEARFTEKNPNCKHGPPVASVQLANDDNSTNPPEHILLINGWILKIHNDSLLESIPPEKYCISRFDENDTLEINYCKSDCSKEPCISKCCLANEVCEFSAPYDECVCKESEGNQWTSTIETSLENQYSFVHHLYDCEATHFTLHKDSKNFTGDFENDDFKILKNGSLLYHRRVDGVWMKIPDGKYCVDGAGVPLPSNATTQFSGEINDLVLHLCRDAEDLGPEEPTQQQFILNSILVPFAIVFILMTIVVYLLTLLEHNHYGWSILSYLVTLLALYVTIVIDNAHSRSFASKYPKICATIAGAIHFSYLSSVCWVTCISYDVWRTFRTMNSVTCNQMCKGKRRFVMFSLFSIGFPLIIILTCVTLHMIYVDIPTENMPVFLPNYGKIGYCSMSNDGTTYYLILPITGLLLFNMGFFIATIASMKHYKKSIREAFAEISNNPNPSKANQSFGIYARLFIIMGIFWISQIISWFVLLKNNTTTESTLIFGVTDALTVLQAVAIFYIFVCKRSIFVKLWTLHPWLRPLLSLGVKYGCCPPPTAPDMRKFCTAHGIRGTLKNSPSNRNSRDSNSSAGITLKNIGKNAKVLTRQPSDNSADGSCISTLTEEDIPKGTDEGSTSPNSSPSAIKQTSESKF